MVYGKSVEDAFRKYRAVIPYLLAFGICLFVSLPVFSQSVVLDDAYSVTLVRGSVREIIRGAASDVHPPLYYLILKCSSFFGGESIVKYRFVTVFATYLNVILLGATFIRRRWGNRTAVFYLLWFGGVYRTVDLSNLIRMYSWGAFFVTALALHLFFYYEKGLKRDYLLGILMTLAAMYTHYYALLSAFAMWVLILAAAIIHKREKVKWILLGGVCVAAGYFPWALAFVSQVRGVAHDYWIPAIGWREWFGTSAQMMECVLTGVGTPLYFLVLALVLLAVLRRQRDALLFFSVFAGTMLSGMLLSILIAPIWQERYMYVAWGCLTLAAAIVMGEKTSEFSFIPQLVCGGVLCLVFAMAFRTISQDPLLKSDDREWVSFIRAEMEPDALIIVDNPGEHSCVFATYFPDAELIMTEYLDEKERKEELRLSLEAAGDGQIWYVFDSTLSRLGYEEMSEMLQEMDYEVDAEPVAAYTIKYKNLRIYRVEKKAYEK